MKDENPLMRIFAVSVIGIVIVTIIASYTNSSKKTITEYAAYSVQQNSINVSNEIKTYIDSAINDIQLTSDIVSKSIKGNTFENTNELLKTFIGRTPFSFIEYKKFDESEEKLVVDDNVDTCYREGMNGRTGIWINFDPLLAPEFLINFYTPLHYQGKIAGVITGLVDSKSIFHPLMNSKYFEEDMIGILCDYDGKIISASFNFNDVVTLDNILMLRGVSIDGIARFKDHISYSDNAVFNYYETGGIGLACVKNVPNTDWTVIQIIPATSFKGILYKTIYGQIFISGIVILIFVFYIVSISISSKNNKKKMLAENRKLSKERLEDKEKYYQMVQETLIKSEKYKNAILSEAIIVMEVNLTQNIMDYGKIKIDTNKTVSIEDIIGTRFPCTYDYYIEKWLEKFIKPATRESFNRNLNRRYLLDCAAVGRSEIVYEYPVVGLHGEDLYVRRTTILTTDENSGDVIAYCNVKDITSRREKELMLLNYEKILLTTATDMYKGVRQVDLKDFTAVYHYFKDDRIESTEMGDWMTWVERQKNNIYPEDYPKVRDFLDKSMLLNMAFGITYRIDYRANSKNDKGSNRVYTSTVSKTIINDRPYALFVTIDSTSTVENEAAQRKIVEDALVRARSANNAKSIFLSNMSHDIRTPMNAIVGFTRLAINHIENRDTTKDYLDKILSASNHLLSLINDVLDMSRIESGKVHLEESENDLCEIARDLENIIISDVKKKNLKFTINTDKIINSRIYCDKLRMNQIFLNLLGNAVKFTNPGGRIEFSVEEIHSEEKILYRFHVQDNGIGMSKEFIQKVFEPFERERSSTVSGIQGTGLGMSITKHLVDMMNGDISVKSEKDVGTEITVTLPLRISGEQSVIEEIQMVKENPDAVSSFKHKGKRILLTEDNELNREIANAILTEAGFEVDEAEDGTFAVEKLLEKGHGYYSLVLMDIQMPIMDGYAAARKIREFEDKDLASIPIIAMTANAFDEDKKKAIEAGMNDHISKPIDVAKLFESIKRFCS